MRHEIEWIVTLTPLQLETRCWGQITWNYYREGFGGSEGVEARPQKFVNTQ